MTAACHVYGQGAINNITLSPTTRIVRPGVCLRLGERESGASAISSGLAVGGNQATGGEVPRYIVRY